MKPSGEKKRLDQLLGERYPDLSRTKIQAEIMAGNVLVDGIVTDKPGHKVSSGSDLELKKKDNPYVSRGGLKLEGALDYFNLGVEGITVLDVGASTGGFTDCLLQRGAAQVYALDVGYGQLDYKLRNDPRVIVMERFNIRDLKPGDLNPPPEFAVVDVSFISLSKVLPVLNNIGIPSILALVKPQFEVGKAEADRGKGVIRDKNLHREVLINTAGYALDCGYITRGLAYSGITGPKGNIEYYIYLNSVNEGEVLDVKALEVEVDNTVDAAHHKFFPARG